MPRLIQHIQQKAFTREKALSYLSEKPEMLGTAVTRAVNGMAKADGASQARTMQARDYGEQILTAIEQNTATVEGQLFDIERDLHAIQASAPQNHPEVQAVNRKLRKGHERLAYINGSRSALKPTEPTTRVKHLPLDLLQVSLLQLVSLRIMFLWESLAVL